MAGVKRLPTYWCMNFEHTENLRHGIANGFWMMQYQYAKDQDHLFQDTQKQKGAIARNWNYVKELQAGDRVVAYCKPNTFYAVGTITEPTKPKTAKDHVSTIAHYLKMRQSHDYEECYVFYPPSVLYEDFTDPWISPPDRDGMSYRYAQRIDVDIWQLYVPKGVNEPGLGRNPKSTRAVFPISPDLFQQIEDNLRGAAPQLFALPADYDGPRPDQLLDQLGPFLERHGFSLEITTPGIVYVMRGRSKVGYFNNSIAADHAVMGYHTDFPKNSGIFRNGIPVAEANNFKKWFAERCKCDEGVIHCRYSGRKQGKPVAYPEILDAKATLYVLLLDAKTDAATLEKEMASFDGQAEEMANKAGRQATRQRRIRFSTSEADLADDLATIFQRPKTTIKTFVEARLGQGGFRKQVLELWDNCCAVTGTATREAIRASHIKPWRKSNDDERLSPENGLPLVASLDALFDAGLITFDASGQMVLATSLDDAERETLGIVGKSLRNEPSGETKQYLEYHRKEIFQG